MRILGPRGRLRRVAAAGAGVLTTALLGAVPAVAHAAESCSAGWQSTILADGLGGLENLEPDSRGGFYLSGNEAGVIYHRDAGGRLTTVARGLDAPAGLQLAGSALYFLTGDDTAGNLGQLPTGTLQRLDIDTGRTHTLATGLIAPNGLLRLPDGDLLISRVALGGPVTGITRYRASTGALVPAWSPVPRSNGLAFTPDHRAVYTDDDVTAQIYRIPLDNPREWTVVSTLPDPLSTPDDLAVTSDGTLYVAANAGGAVYRVDPATGHACSIISGIYTAHYPPGPTSVRIAPDGNTRALYLTSEDGTLRRLRPPPNTDLTLLAGQGVDDAVGGGFGVG